ncbi:hypothetical protein CISG_08396 [Coccidioides immitis RMSCC 3703]|uniref:Uncharacterized protein n=1 Tax=Coccidioides immitis RMSCC 3703 TaxID=454286 RepID=A0A0J8R770_COCIT|nr:hypothetical protein CISG_08396 [Coccidioides immitis RMSCC 3703]
MGKGIFLFWNFAPARSSGGGGKICTENASNKATRHGANLSADHDRRGWRVVMSSTRSKWRYGLTSYRKPRFSLLAFNSPGMPYNISTPSDMPKNKSESWRYEIVLSL